MVGAGEERGVEITILPLRFVGIVVCTCKNVRAVCVCWLWWFCTAHVNVMWMVCYYLFFFFFFLKLVITYYSNNTMSNFEILDYHLRWVLYLQSIRVVYALPFGGFCTAQRECDVNGFFFFLNIKYI